MFFGAGNLIFPMIIGKAAGDQTPYALLGLSLSAVLFPFLGLMAMSLFGGNVRSFLSPMGRIGTLVLLLLLQIAQGPLGSLPRLFTLMHASIKAYVPGFELSLFSIVIAAVIFLLTFRPSKIVDLLGIVLTPLLLLSLATLFVFGFINGPEAPHVTESGWYHFLEGIKGGYQTLDLIGSILFSALILDHLAAQLGGSPNDPGLAKSMKWVSAIAAGLLFASYVGLCWLASHWGPALEGVRGPEELFYAISVMILGPWGGLVSALAVFLACLTTAVSLAAVFSQYLQTDICRGKISQFQALVATLALTAGVANLGFTGIVKLVGPLLEWLYPILIVLSVYSIVKARRNKLPIVTGA
ncbi:MAG: hypothetical protein RL235_298 [Chlamydiota bacterium]